MPVFHATHLVRTGGRGFFDITDALRDFARQSGIASGLCTVFLQHTSASLLVTENADPDVRRDLETFFARLVRDGDSMWRHDAEGPDDMPSHVRAALTQTAVSIPLVDGRLALGTWQGVYVYEHRLSPHARRLVVTIVG